MRKALPAHNPASARHNTTEVISIMNKPIPNEKSITIGKTVYNVKRKFGTRSLEDLMLEHILENNTSNNPFDVRPAL